MSEAGHEIQRLLETTVRRYVDSGAAIIKVDSTRLGLGFQAVDLTRHHLLIETAKGTEELSLITKVATALEQRVTAHLYEQGAKVPFIWPDTGAPISEERSLVCFQDVDYRTDYGKLDLERLQQCEISALADIHGKNRGLRHELSWLLFADLSHITDMLHTRFQPQWEASKQNEAFNEEFGPYIPIVEAAARTITDDMVTVIKDETTHTLIHNDLNPGNVLVHDNQEVFFIDWEEARYGSLFLDLPLRCRTMQQVLQYREALGVQGVELADAQFTTLFSIASRYLGLRFMSWNLGAWMDNAPAKADLIRYLHMVANESLHT
ncbi:phosphotransferase [Paenibacillus sp. NPDC058177]|uniref:phosphotransferase n=1 Tax=Paenibacillus sp. NPDC058177 TaxID=3346369 RepID=UPI0036DDD958